MKTCINCDETKPLSDYHIRSNNGKYQNTCKSCLNKKNSLRVTQHRRDCKEKLVIFFGSKCVDCSYIGPPFMFDFDHRDPSQKQFSLASGAGPKSYSRMLAEAEKCDLVCSNCHRFRTHKQRCSGCRYCS